MAIFGCFGCWVSFPPTPTLTPSLQVGWGGGDSRLLILSHCFDFVSFLYLFDIKNVTRLLSMLGVVGVEGVGYSVCLATIYYARTPI